jgi:hypothetical protein
MMERESSAPGTDGAIDEMTTSQRSVAGEQQEHLRSALLAAAEEESAAIIEQARRDITTTVRRARRDLHLIRAQLHLCGLEMPTRQLDESLHQGATLLHEEVPHDAIAVSGQPSLHHVVTEASQELAQLSTTVHVPVAANDPVGVSAPEPSPTRMKDTAVLVSAGVLLLVVVTGVAGWLYYHPDDRLIAGEGTRTSATAADSSGKSTSIEQAGAVGLQAAKTEPTPVPPSRIVLQTNRPVWMRVELDGNHDVGRVYPEGALAEFDPTREAVIRVGDAGAVLLGVGGAVPMPFGQAGQALTRRISVAASPTPPAARTDTVRPPDPPAPGGAGNAPAPPPAETVMNPVPPEPRRSEAAAESPPPAATVTDQQHAEIFAKHERWLDAYSRGDSQSLRTLTVDSFSLRDERAGQAKTGNTAGKPQVLDVRIDIAGVGAVLTGRLRTFTDGVPNDSLLSEVWVRDGQQQWALMGVRITPLAPGQQQ